MCFHLIEFWTVLPFFFSFSRKTWCTIRFGWSSCPKQFIWYGLYNPSQIFQGFRTEEVYIRAQFVCVSLVIDMFWYAYICDFVLLFRELERVLSEMAIKCCLDKVESTWIEYVDLFLSFAFQAVFFFEIRYLPYCCLSVILVVYVLL